MLGKIFMCEFHLRKRSSERYLNFGLMNFFVTTLGNITRAKGAKDAKLGEMGKCFSLRS